MYVGFFYLCHQLIITLYLVIITKFHFILSKTHTGSFKLSKSQLITMHCYIFLSNIIFFRRTVFVIKYYDFKPSYLYMYTLVSYTCILIYFSRATIIIYVYTSTCGIHMYLYTDIGWTNISYMKTIAHALFF